MTFKNSGLSVIILCGGKGTRMGEAQAPKAMAEVGDRPIIWHVMKIFSAFGHNHFILATGYLGEQIRRYFLEYEALTRDVTIRLGDNSELKFHQSRDAEDWRVTLVDTGLEANKGARVRRAARYVEGERFFVTYADGVGDVDLHALLTFHRAHGRLATVTGVCPYSQYGVIETTPEGCVTGFREKPQLEHWINGGFMLFEQGVKDHLIGDELLDLEKDVLPRLAADGQLMMYRHAGFWRSMDTFKEAQELDALWQNCAPWKVW